MVGGLTFLSPYDRLRAKITRPEVLLGTIRTRTRRI